MSIGDFPESLSQAMLVWIMLVGRLSISGSWRRAIAGVPWRESVSACLARGDLFVDDASEKVMKRPSLLRHRGTPIGYSLQGVQWEGGAVDGGSIIQ